MERIMSKPGSVRSRVKHLEQLVGLLLQVVEQHDKYLYGIITQAWNKDIDLIDIKDAIIERQKPKEAEEENV